MSPVEWETTKFIFGSFLFFSYCQHYYFLCKLIKIWEKYNVSDFIFTKEYFEPIFEIKLLFLDYNFKMKTKESSLKRISFQGVINTEQQKLPQKSRSKSKNRSKASSITKNNLSMTNRSNTSITKTNKVEAKTSRHPTQVQNPAKTTVNQSIFRSTKRNVQQQLMKKIIKLKNSTLQLQNNIKKQQQNIKNASQTFTNKENQQQNSKLEQTDNFLQEFDSEIRRQTKEIGQFYVKQIDELDMDYSQIKQLKTLQFKPLSVPHVMPSMPNLQDKLKQIQNNWLKK